MGTQHQRFFVFWLEFGNNARPQQTRSTQLGNLHVEVHRNAPEKAQARGKLVDIKTRGNRRADIFLAIGQRVGQLQCGIGTGFLDVVAGDRDGVELRHMAGSIGDDVTDDFHRWRRRVDIGVAHHEFFQDVVLDGAGQLVLAHALLLGSNDITGQHRQYRTVHGH